MGESAAVHLHGRQPEQSRIDAFLDRGSVLLIEGEAGVGKSVLLERALAVARRRGTQALLCRPAQAETGYAYAGLADLLGSPSAMAAIQRIPAVRRGALEIALRQRVATSPVEPHVVALALADVLTLLAERAVVLIMVDDIQWLDPASDVALGFAARRVIGAPVRILLARRGTQPGPAPWALDREPDPHCYTTMFLNGLDPDALFDLLRERLGVGIPRPVLIRMHEMCRGNPFYALQIARTLPAGAATPSNAPWPIPDSLAALLTARFAELDPTTTEVLLAVSAMASPTMDRICQAIGPTAQAALDQAERAGLVSIDSTGRVRFTHPLYASAVYRAVPPPDRRAMHRVLAAVETESEASARHLALATVGPDDQVATALDRAAADAKLHGATAAAADLLRLALTRTPPRDHGARDLRTVLLAEVLFDGGDLDSVVELLDQALPRLSPGPLRARARMVRGTVSWYRDPGPLARDTLCAALADADTDPTLRGQLHGRLAVFSDADQAAARDHATAAVAALELAGPSDLLASALCTLFYTSILAGDPPQAELLHRGLSMEDVRGSTDQSTTPGFWYLALDEYELARDRFHTMRRRCEARGELSSEPDLLSRLGEVEAIAGNLPLAREYADAAVRAARQLGHDHYDPSVRLRILLDALAGNVDRAAAAAQEQARRAEAEHEILLAAAYLAVEAFAAVSRADYARAVRASDQARTHLATIGIREPLGRTDSTPDRVEALVHIGELDAAQRLLTEMADRMTMIPRPWLTAAHCRGTAELAAARGDVAGAVQTTDLVTTDEAARWRPLDRGRTLLTRGRMLRRARLPALAFEALRDASAIFTTIGAHAWHSLAAAESARLGRQRTRDNGLTPTEQQVIRLTAGGSTNRETAAIMHISPKTVEAHLTRIYRKLGIHSRAELGVRYGQRSHLPPR